MNEKCFSVPRERLKFIREDFQPFLLELSNQSKNLHGMEKLKNMEGNNLRRIIDLVSNLQMN